MKRWWSVRGRKLLEQWHLKRWCHCVSHFWYVSSFLSFLTLVESCNKFADYRSWNS